MWPFEWRHYRCHFVTLEVFFAVFTFIDIFLRYVPTRHDSVFNSSVKNGHILTDA